MQYIISKKATEDLEQIWQYTYFQWSEQQADKYYNLLIEKMEWIAQNVTAGHEIDDIKKGIEGLSFEIEQSHPTP